MASSQPGADDAGARAPRAGLHSDQRADGEAEFVAFVRATSDSLHRTAYLLTGSRVGAQDAVQAALTRVYLAWERRGQWGNRVAYARRCVVNVVLSEQSRAWRGELAHGDFADRLMGLRRGRDPRGRRARPAQACADDAAAPSTHRGRPASLPRSVRSAGSDRARLRVGTVKSLTARGLVALRAELEEQS